jgi:hypothetical protein
MAYSLTATGGAGKVTLSGSGYTGSDCIVTVTFSATGRHFNEMRKVPVSGGTVSVDVPVVFAGNVTVRAFDAVGATTLATSNSVSAT